MRYREFGQIKKNEEYQQRTKKSGQKYIPLLFSFLLPVIVILVHMVVWSNNDGSFFSSSNNTKNFDTSMVFLPLLTSNVSFIHLAMMIMIVNVRVWFIVNDIIIIINLNDEQKKKNRIGLNNDDVWLDEELNWWNRKSRLRRPP